MINPTTDVISSFTVPTANAAPSGITAGPNGNLWFTELNADKIGEINPTTHAISEFSLPAGSGGPVNIAAGPDGNLWFGQKTHEIGEINPTTHAISEFTEPLCCYVGTAAITAGPDGNVWFSQALSRSRSTRPPMRSRSSTTAGKRGESRRGRTVMYGSPPASTTSG